MKISVFGAGNIGTFIAAYLSGNQTNNVFIYTKNKEKFTQKIEIVDTEKNEKHCSNEIEISDDLQRVVSNSNYIFITYPSQILHDNILKISEFLTENTKIVIVPGTGGVEFYSNLITEKHCTLVGLQRVPAICRLIEYGKSVCVTGWKNELFVSCIPNIDEVNIIDDLSKLFNIKTTTVGKYYNITFTPSNPILHTSRLYGMFKDYSGNIVYNKKILFYEEWDNFSSEVMIKCDTELQKIYKIVSSNDTKVTALLPYYESYNAESLTKKIRSIKSFKGIFAPMKTKENGFIPDLNSRYFSEDFPFGLCIIKGFALIYGIETPMIDTVIRWFQNLYEKEYIDINGNQGKDCSETAMPQRFGVNTKNDVLTIYQKQ